MGHQIVGHHLRLRHAQCAQDQRRQHAGAVLAGRAVEDQRQLAGDEVAEDGAVALGINAFHKVLNTVALLCTVLHYVAQFCTVLHCVALFCTVFTCCNVLHVCTAFRTASCTALHCFAH